MKVTIGIFGMTCMHCHKRVTDAISKVKGVKSVDVSLENKGATVDFDESVTNLNAIKKAVTDAGYDVGEKPILKPVISSTVNVSVEQASITYEPSLVSQKDIEGAIKSIGYGIVKDKISFDIGGMTCAACAQ